ncbi:MAG: hypothetical protein Fur0037_23900 [Planctomycetota bacterium]
MIPRILIGALLLMSCQGPRPDPRDEDRLIEARGMLSSDPDRALAIADQLLERYGSWREARLLIADGSFALYKDQRRENRELLLQDAIASYEIASGLGAPDASCLLSLAEARLEARRWEGAIAAADEAAALAASGDRETWIRARLVAASASFRKFAAEREREIRTGTPDGTASCPSPGGRPNSPRARSRA